MVTSWKFAWITPNVWSMPRKKFNRRTSSYPLYSTVIKFRKLFMVSLNKHFCFTCRLVLIKSFVCGQIFEFSLLPIKSKVCWLMLVSLAAFCKLCLKIGFDKWIDFCIFKWSGFIFSKYFIWLFFSLVISSERFLIIVLIYFVILFNLVYNLVISTYK